jgi:hypothetical protein
LRDNATFLYSYMLLEESEDDSKEGWGRGFLKRTRRK